MQLIKIKQDYDQVNIVINGGAGAPAVSPPNLDETSTQKCKSTPKLLTERNPKVAAELAAANIPVILNPFRSAPWQWQNLDGLVGPPLTKSSARVLADAGVTFGIAMGGISTSCLSY